MKNRKILPLFVWSMLTMTSVCGQNLFVNSSFEEYSLPCDSILGWGKVTDAFGWNTAKRDYNRDSDFMSNCSHFNFNTPSNMLGYQQARFGSNYCFLALGVYWNSFSNNTLLFETIQPSIIKTLEPNVCYEIRMDISLADYSNRNWDFGLDLYFTDEEFQMNSHDDPGIIPQYSFGRMDTLSKSHWRRISMEVAFTDTMKYLTISWFTSPWNYPDNSFFEAGYYIDNVVLYPCSAQTYVADAGSDQLACVGDSVTFSTPYRNNEYRYAWIKGNGDTLSTTTSLTVEAAENTEYYLSQWDFKYEETWDTVRVFIEGCPELELPNVFTPNGDNQNDLWLPRTKEVIEIDISIFSRWGESVFHYSGAAQDFPGWDGADVPEGTYYAVVKARSDQGRTIEEKGSLTLFR